MPLPALAPLTVTVKFETRESGKSMSPLPALNAPVSIVILPTAVAPSPSEAPLQLEIEGLLRREGRRRQDGRRQDHCRLLDGLVHFLAPL